MRPVWIVLLEGFSLYDAALTMHAFAGSNDVLRDAGISAQYDIKVLATEATCASALTNVAMVVETLPLSVRTRSGNASLILIGGSMHRARHRAASDVDVALVAWLVRNHEKFGRLATVGEDARNAMHQAELHANRTGAQSFFTAPMCSANTLALRFIAQDVGYRCAEQVAQRLSPHTNGHGTVVIASMMPERSAPADERVQNLNRWIARNMQARLTVDSLAQRMRMSSRTFARFYRHAMGMTPARAVERIRLGHAAQAVASTLLSFKVIAMRCGFSSEEVMRRSFLRVMQLSPTEYRQLFGPRR